jgi:putative ABC transport system substrate-binding protein
MLNRRTFLCGAIAIALAPPLAVEAEQTGKVYHIGVLGFPSREASAPFLKAFEDGLRELGYVEGKNIAIESRFADGNTDRLPDLAAELVRLNVDVIMAGTTVAYFPQPIGVAAGRLTKTIPIVMFHADPVGSGLVASLSRPGGNITGLSLFNPGIAGKQLELMSVVVPRITRVAIFRNPTNSAHAFSMMALAGPARSLGIQLHAFEARGPGDFESAFAVMIRDGAQALMVLGDSMFFTHRTRIADLSKQRRLPTIAVQRQLSEAGTLMAYGANVFDMYRRAASYVDKILKGAKPADLPVEQPTKLELVINLKTARALGLTIPPSLLLRADQVIE